MYDHQVSVHLLFTNTVIFVILHIHFFYKSRLLNPKVVVKDATPVDTVAKISDVKQKTFTNFDVTMSKALETVTASDFTMVRDNDNQVITVKSATLDATDKTKVSLTVYTSLTDAKTYTVTYTAADEAKTQSSKQVTVTDGTVASVNVTPVEITANSETTIYYQTLDAQGVIVSEKKIMDKSDSKVDVVCNTLLGTLDENTSNLILYNVGDTATFTVTYHTYKYDTTTGAEEGVIKKDFTISAIKDANVISQYRYTVATEQPYDWSKVTPVSTVALDDGENNVGTRKAFFQIKNQNGVDVTDSCNYTVESSDNSKLVADGAVTGGVTLRPVSTGSAYLMIKDGDGKVVSTLPITVGEKRKLSVFKLDRNNVSIANTDTSSVEVAKAYVEVTAKDQYGEDIGITLSKTIRSDNDGVVVNDQYAANDKTVQIYTNKLVTANKTSTYTLTAVDRHGNAMTTTLNVTTKDRKLNQDTYSVAFLDANDKVISSVDTTVNEGEDNTSATGTEVKSFVVVKNNGVVFNTLRADVGNVSCAAVNVTRVGDNKLFFKAASGSAATTTSAAISNDSIDYYTGVTANDLTIAVTTPAGVTTLNNPLEKNLSAGNYTVLYEIKVNGKTYKPYATLAITDKQTSVTATIANTASGDKKFSSIMGDADFAKFYYGDVQLKTGEYSYESADYVINNNGKNAFVKSVTLSVKAASSDNYFKVTVPVNKTFTHNTDWSGSDF